MQFRHLFCCVGLAAVIVPSMSVKADEIDRQFNAIAAVGPQGKGSPAARKARDQLAQHDITILPRLLEAMDTPNVIAANWYRTVYEQVVARESAKEKPNWPRKFLHTYVAQPERQGKVRRLVLRLLEKLEPGYQARFLVRQLDDPEFRSEAVDLTLSAGDIAKKANDLPGARTSYRAAFNSARDSGQIARAASALKSVGEEVSIIDHMGFVIDWYLLGPFDAPEKTGYSKSFPPEKSVDLTATYAGQNKKQIGWKRFRTGDALGQLNLIQAIASTREAVGYAYAEITSPRDQDVELRCGADDNLTVWLNGKQIFTRKQWLNGTRLDRFTAPAKLRQGKNRVLVKVCQGPQHKNPAVPNNWSMQLRFCSKNGGPVGVKSALPTIARTP